MPRLSIEQLARKVISQRIKVSVEDAILFGYTMYVNSAYQAVMEAIKEDRKGRRARR